VAYIRWQNLTNKFKHFYNSGLGTPKRAPFAVYTVPALFNADYQQQTLTYCENNININKFMESSKIMMFPEMGSNNGIDPNLLLALNNNGGFGGNNWIWVLFLWLIWGANGWGGNGFGGGNNGFLSNQIANDSGRELLMNAIQGNGNAIRDLAGLLNTEISTVQNGIFTLNNAITSVGTQVGMSGLQI